MTEKRVHNIEWTEAQSTLLHERRKEDNWSEPCSTEHRDHPLLHPGCVDYDVPQQFNRECGSYKNRSEAGRKNGHTYVSREGTPFIELMECNRCAGEMMKKLRRKAPSDTPYKVVGLIVVNPNVALQRQGQVHRDGKQAVLDLGSQLRHFGMENPLEGHPAELGNRLLYLDKIERTDVVGRWPWAELENNERWYEDVILPAFRKHDEAFQEAQRMARLKKKLEQTKTKENNVEVADEKKSSDSDEDSLTFQKDEAQKAFRRRRTICDHISRLWKKPKARSPVNGKSKMAEKGEQMSKKKGF
ncbi:uncharacterized protein BDV17DRAFT_290247 [Aspergillus undulatus]|uniref:uncharacterized protein n=1 Tax=Aspergillus undulatus TaxID=1810928 RepID=UPI003CCD78A0